MSMLLLSMLPESLLLNDEQSLKNIRGECYCTEDPGIPGTVFDCGYRCFGDPTTFCGGVKNNTKLYSVFGTGR